MSVPARARLVWHDGQRYSGIDSWGTLVPIDGDRSSAAGAKPSDLLPLSLAACTAYTVIEVLRKQRQTVTGLEVDIAFEQDEAPPWPFRRIECRFRLRGAVDPRKAERALQLAHETQCSVAATLAPAVELGFSIEVMDDGDAR